MSTHGDEAPPPTARPGDVAAKAEVLRRLELDVARRLEGLLSGDYLSLTRGPGTEPAGARQYEPGDDARRIDWNLTARALTPHVRTTDADRELETWVVVDRSASLDFGTALREKRDVALAALAAFGFLTARAGNRLGVLIAGGDTLQRFPAQNGRVGLLAALAVVYDTPRHDRGPGPGADLKAALERLEHTLLRRGQVVIVSDFLDTGWASPLRRLALRHQVVAVHVTDPRELALPAVGMLSVVDPETGRLLHVQSNSQALRARYAAAADERRQRAQRDTEQAGAAYLRLSTGRDWVVDVAKFVGRRRAERSPTASLEGGTPWPR